MTPINDNFEKERFEAQMRKPVTRSEMLDILTRMYQAVGNGWLRNLRDDYVKEWTKDD